MATSSPKSGGFYLNGEQGSAPLSLVDQRNTKNYGPKPSSSSYSINLGAGEHGQTIFIERQNSIHRNLSKLGENAPLYEGLSRPNSSRSFTSSSDPAGETRSLLSNSERPRYGAAVSEADLNTIRFQVVVWNIGKLDVVSGSVTMTFRVSMFWNDMTGEDDTMSEDGMSTNTSINVWKMHGRQKAFQSELRDIPIKALEVPPLAILNVATFETIGQPDVDMLRESTRLMRWTCMYRATVIQEDVQVDQFPHDDHDVSLKFGILSHRGKGRVWDRRVWKLALATSDDNMNSTRIPHGLIVDQARIPGFAYNKERGLEFQFCKLDHGSTSDQQTPHESSDVYLKVSLNVLRESGYYDKNIVPLLALLNIVAVSVLTFEDTEFFYRALITLNIAFVEMNIRMTADGHLPSVGYEIRLQRVLNEFFVVLMMLVLEAMAVYVLSTYYHVSTDVTKVIDWLMGIFAVAHNAITLGRYYQSKQRAERRLNYGWKSKQAQKSV